MQLVIIAGGKGTRLGLKDIPKPMAKINNKPILEYQIELAAKSNIDEIFIMEGHFSEVIEDYFQNGEKYGIKIHHIKEKKPLGTAGCFKLIENRLKERFMVFYGDILMDFDIDSFINFDKKQKSTGTIIIHPNNHPYDSDLIAKNKENQITEIISKPHSANEYNNNLVNAGVYILSKEIFKYIEDGVEQDFGKDVFKKVLKDNKVLMGYKTAEYIKDIGTKERFCQAENDILKNIPFLQNKKHKRPCIFLDRDGVINENMDITPSVKNFKLINGAAEAISVINKSGFLAVIVTNQPMIAKGFISFEDTEAIHKKMETLLGEKNAFIDEIYYCPHHPQSGFKGEVKELKKKCNCRKPDIGMLLKAKNDLNIDFEKSWIIGDSQADIDAGKNAKIKTVAIGNISNSDYNTNNLYEAVELIIRMSE